MPDGGIKLLVNNKMQSSIMKNIVCDDELMVDHVITASQQKSTIALPSYGRNLVPYFVPGCEEPGEEDINVNTDVEALRRNGGSVLQVPLPCVAKESCGANRKGQRTTLEASVPPRGKGKSKGLDAAKPPASKGSASSCSPLRIGKNKSLVVEDVSPTSPMDIALLRSSSSDSDSVENEVVPKAIPMKRGTSTRRRSKRQEHGSGHILSKSAPGMSFAAYMESAAEGKRTRKQKGQHAMEKGSKNSLKNENERTGGFSDGNVESSEEGGQQETSFVPAFFPFGYERWAGPSFANSPPPSSLPLPKFPVQKTTSAVAGVFEAAAAGLPRGPFRSQSSPPSPVPFSTSPKSENGDRRHGSSFVEDGSLSAAIGELQKKLNIDSSSKATGLVAKRLDLEDSSVQMALGDDVAVATRELRNILQLS